MYDTSFDHQRAALRRTDRRVLWGVRIVAAAAVLGVLSANVADAQMPGAPILQNVWATPGLVGAINVGGGGGTTVYAAALAWTPEMGRFQVIGGAGAGTGSGTGSRGAYGIRVAAPLGGTSSTVGVAIFGGVGGGPARTQTTAVSCTVFSPGCAVISPTRATSAIFIFDSTTSTTIIPLGASIGWRNAIGSSHGISIYASPTFMYCAGGTSNASLFRMGIGIDGGLTSSLGLTGGLEFGGTRPQAIGGPSGVVYGAGISYAFGKR